MSETEFPEGRNYARILGVRRDLFVEFEFIAGDPTLAVELILPFPAFREFYAVNDVVMLPGDAEVDQAFHKLCWRYGAKFSGLRELGLSQDE